MPDQNCLRITVRYASYMLHESLDKLIDLNITVMQGVHGRANQRLSDEELEQLLINS
jgi:hypothetical protein